MRRLPPHGDNALFGNEHAHGHHIFRICTGVAVDPPENRQHTRFGHHTAGPGPDLQQRLCDQRAQSAFFRQPFQNRFVVGIQVNPQQSLLRPPGVDIGPCQRIFKLSAAKPVAIYQSVGYLIHYSPPLLPFKIGSYYLFGVHAQIKIECIGRHLLTVPPLPMLDTYLDQESASFLDRS